MSTEYLRLESEGADLMEMEKLTLGGLGKAVRDGDIDTGSVMMGQAAGSLSEIRPLAAILEEMVCGAALEEEKLSRLTKGLCSNE